MPFPASAVSPPLQDGDQLAAIDIGSNSFHMVVARYTLGQLRVVDRLRETVRMADGLDGKGYFTEGAADAIPGFDAEYTMLQIDFLARLYVINREPVVLRMLNMVTNELMPRVNTTTWRLNTSGGSRHPQLNREFPFDTAALAVLANLGNRPYMQRFVPSQTAAYIKAFKGDDGERLRYAVGMTTATVLMSQPGSARMR